MAKEKFTGEATPEQIASWKEKYGAGNVYAIKTEQDDENPQAPRHICYLRVPTRKVLGAASETSRNNPIKYSETVLRQCWLGGSQEIKDNDKLFLSVSGKMAELIEIGEAELEKL